MADEDQVDDMPDVSLMGDDIPASTDDTPSQSDEQAAPGTETQDEQKNDAEEKPSEGNQEPAPEEQKPETDDAAAIKARNEAYARQRIQERQRVKQQVERQVDQTYGPKTEEDLINEGYSEQQAQILALREEMNYKEQRTQIAELNAGLQVETVNVVNDFPVFNPNSEDYDKEFAEMVANQYKVAARLQTDENNIVINAEVPLYDFYQQMANIRSQAASKFQQQGQQQYQEMLARTENPGGSSSTSSGNSLDELEERLGDVVIT